MERGSGGEVHSIHHTAHAFTTTVPFMKGWIMQWYVKVPGLSNFCWKVAPTATFLESHTPVSSVTVCVTLSLFVHVTDWPGAMVMDCGAKAKLAIVTAFAPAEAG